MKAPSVHELPRKHQQKLVTPTLRISDFGERDSAMGASHLKYCCCSRRAARAMQSPHDGDGELHRTFAIRPMSWRARRPG